MAKHGSLRSTSTFRIFAAVTREQTDGKRGEENADLRDRGIGPVVRTVLPLACCRRHNKFLRREERR